ncbi:hypothetical protein [Paenibacillus sp. SN-8-1]|uniref:hypothetical protein n=1 Tax=Paenibacillus sp. SN-8-1 TaxID=3435409 RepID=UPI003D9A1129
MTQPNIVEVATLVGDPSRVTMLLELLGGNALPASELARAAHIKQSRQKSLASTSQRDLSSLR